MNEMTESIRTAAFIGIGGAGMNMLNTWLKKLPGDALSIGVNRDRERLDGEHNITHKLLLGSVSDVNAEGDLIRATQAQIQASMAEKMPELMAMLKGRESIILLAGLGGVTGTWASQYVCNDLVALGKQVVTVLVMPFAFEGKRVTMAEEALAGFDGSAHRVLCFNDYLLRNSPEGTSLQDAFALMNDKAFELLSMPK